MNLVSTLFEEKSREIRALVTIPHFFSASQIWGIFASVYTHMLNDAFDCVIQQIMTTNLATGCVIHLVMLLCNN